MKTFQFNEIKNNMNKLITACQEFRDKYGMPENAESLTVKEYNDAKTKAQSLQSRCDKVMQTDMYHIIGMGNLSASQLTAFAKQLRTLGTYRYLIKWFSQTATTVMVGATNTTSTYVTSLSKTPLKVKVS